MKITRVVCFNLLFFTLFCKVQSHPSWGIAKNAAGEVYLADVMHGGQGCVWKIDSSGAAAMVLEGFHCHALVLQPDGHIYAAGSRVEKGQEWHTLVQIKTGGIIHELFRTKSWNEFYAGAFSMDRAGNAYFLNRKQLWQRSPDGEVKSFSPHRFKWANNMVSTVEGEVYVLEKRERGGTLYCINAEGKPDWIAEGLIAYPADTINCPEEHDRRILGMCLDAESHVYLTSNCARQILKVSPMGETSIFYRSESDWYPVGLCFDGDEAFIIEVNQSGGIFGPRIIRWKKGVSRSVWVDLS
ncbi:hypothetical protein [Phaeodactylibacter sp.]|uniref:hypothetical protein n=1 Tax=Phaeodactylibacter sp. TaxID=1940289 RepID=UPI0025EF339F|nr:hypothetical protein [Phaeodactylibacter sp.]MCI4648245.1 hypothetical protein [Phaeodactylibacter sp.]MCI5091900.1 hypothetical protein [Phaeodactylibacter sp.]